MDGGLLLLSERPTLVSEPQTTTEVVSDLTRDQLLAAIADAIEGCGIANLGGIERIEDYAREAVDSLPIDNTVFNVIDGVLGELGKPTDGTVGGVMEALGYDRRSEDAKHFAHQIGCDCHGPEISPEMAAKRVRALQSGSPETDVSAIRSSTE